MKGNTPAPRKSAAKKETPKRTPRKRTASATKPAPRNSYLLPILVAVMALIVGGLIAKRMDDNDGANSNAPVDTVQVVDDVTAPPAADPTAPVPTTPTVAPEGFVPFEIPTQGEATAPSGTCAEGDVQVLDVLKWVALYDDQAGTGLVVCFLQDTVVRAPWGAYISDSDANRQQEDLLLTGCGIATGCESVTIKFWPES